jgi:ABC-type transport system, involved in lipoprotein release, permease component
MITSLLTLAWKSLLNRRTTTLLTALTIALSVALLLGVEKIRAGARASFATTISGTDLIVGARSGATQLLLYSVFRIGEPTNNISWETYQEIAARPDVAWTIPLSLGDSHRGFPVLGTSDDYFRLFRYGRGRSLAVVDGAPFADLFDAVIGADVAERLGYRVGDAIVLSHGAGALNLYTHADKPFRISGILARTGTPVDRTIHVSLAAIEAIHVDWIDGVPPLPGTSVDAGAVRGLNLQPTTITAMLVGLKSRLAIFQAQRDINTYAEEPLLAVIPGVALQSLWSSLGTMEAALLVISAFVVVTGFAGMVTTTLAGLGERRREIAVLRSVGARPRDIFVLLVLESAGLAMIGGLLGLAFIYAALVIAQPILETRLGLFLPILPPSAGDALILGLVAAAGCIAGTIPAWRAYRMTLANGLMVVT